ncbi:hypothetical protein Syun_010956 [Stephania yunnanensis]|uniref:Purine permease 5 n=1 Tax=Stephania yunnanensis TaxID=152371 RepID=A0AAP0JWW3_9MAGN
MEINSSRNQGDTAEDSSGTKRLSATLVERISELSAATWELYKRKPISYWVLLASSIGAMLVAFPASSLLSRLYFADGGKSKWIISWVAVADSDRFSYISKSQYTWGFIWDVLGSALHGLIFALSELVFVKLLGRRSFHVVLEQQVMVSLSAFVFTTIGVIVNNDFKGMQSEARRFKHGESSYYMVLIWAGITFQLGVLGGTAVLYLASTVLAGVLNAVRVPLTSIAAVILFHDPMSGFKILSLIITFWGFGSYIFGHSFASKAPT